MLTTASTVENGEAMSHSTRTQAISEKLRRRVGRAIVAIGAVLALSGSSLVGSASEAQAAGCTAGVICGWVYNSSASTASIRVGTDWNGSTVTGSTAYVARGSFSTSGTDWDAFYVPAGYCARAFRPAGKGAVQLGTTNRIGLTGKWVKVDNLGAHVVLKSGVCG